MDTFNKFTVISIIFLVILIILHTSEPSPSYRDTHRAMRAWWYGIPEEEHVVKLTGGDFDERIIATGSTAAAAVMFYAEYCRHSKTPRGSFAAAAAQLSRDGSQVVFGAVDCKRTEGICERYNEISGYPTFLYFVNGKVVDIFDDDRTKENFISWIYINNDLSSERNYDDDDDDDVEESEELVSMTTKEPISVTPSTMVPTTTTTTVTPEPRPAQENGVSRLFSWIRSQFST